MTTISQHKRHTQKQRQTIPLMAAVSVLVTAVCGYLYCSHLSEFFGSVYDGRFQNQTSLSQENFALLLRYLAGVQLIYYIVMTVLACLVILNRRRQGQAVLFFMAALKLTTLAMMLPVGASFAFHYGFECLVEAVLLVHIARLTKGAVTAEEALAQLNVTVLAGIAVELIPLIRNLQCLPAEGLCFWGKAGCILLPLATVFSFFALGLYRIHAVRRPKRRPAPVLRLEGWQLSPAVHEVSTRISG